MLLFLVYLFFTVCAWIHILASVSFYVHLEFLWESKPLAAHFTDEPFPVVLQLMSVASISCFKVFRTVCTEKSVARVFCFNVIVNVLSCSK